MNCVKSVQCVQCVHCEGHDELINQNDGYYVCSNCGTVCHDDISEITEWDANNMSVDQYINPYSCVSTFTQKGSKSSITIDNKIVTSDIYKFHVQNSYNNKQRSFDIVESLIDNTNYSQSIKNTAKTLWSEITKTKKIIRGSPKREQCCLGEEVAHIVLHPIDRVVSRRHVIDILVLVVNRVAKREKLDCWDHRSVNLFDERQAVRLCCPTTIDLQTRETLGSRGLVKVSAAACVE